MQNEAEKHFGQLFRNNQTNSKSNLEMRLEIDGMEVLFPYPSIYPEQYTYMQELKRTLDAKGHCLLEMPTGTGKTVTLLSFITSYQVAYPTTGKLIYCTRTVPEMQQCATELKRVMNYRAEFMKENGGVKKDILAICLSSRRNMCCHPKVMAEGEREKVDALCRDLTATWVREKAKAEKNEDKVCSYFENYEKRGSEAASVVPPGVYSISDIKDLGSLNGWCPYFMARSLITTANVVIYNYQYMLDPKIASLVSKELEKESIVVFDEAHNIDSVCIEALSVNIDNRVLEGANRNISRLRGMVKNMKASDERKLRSEYDNLVAGLVNSGGIPAANIGDQTLANPVLPEDILNAAIPGSIRRAEHFVNFMRIILEHLGTRLATRNVESESPSTFLFKMRQGIELDVKALKFCYARLNSLLRTLEIVGLDEFRPISLVADFCTLIGTYAKGFVILVQPFDKRTPNIFDPILQLACVDSSLAIKNVFERFQSVVITSGTLSPLDLYPKLLRFDPVISRSFPMSISRKCICPLIITRGSDQLPISTSYEKRSNMDIVRNYGTLLEEFARVVPDGMVVFLTSYSFLESMVRFWDESGVLNRVLKHKLIFIETKDVVETTLALNNFKAACDSGRGAIFLSIARGKVAEGIDFNGHYGRAVLLFGVPYQYTESLTLKSRLQFLLNEHNIKEAEFLMFDAVRQCAQCVGRVIRSKQDYGIMVFADSRFNDFKLRSKLPMWVTQFIEDNNRNLSTEMGTTLSNAFLREMAQVPTTDGKGVSYYTAEDIEKLKRSEAAEKGAKEKEKEKGRTTTNTTSSGGGRADDPMEIE